MPTNFYFLIGVQLCIFLMVLYRYKKPKDAILKIIFVSALFGLVYGVLFDVIFGLLGSFTYHTGRATGMDVPWGLDFLQLVFNGIFSYGLAVATVYFLRPKTSSLERNKTQKKYVLFSLLAVLGAAVTISLFIKDALVSLFVYGIVVLTLCELIVLCCTKSDLLISRIQSSKYKEVFHLWIQISILGFLYEVTNSFFPFWEFLPYSDYPHILVEFLIVIFGYVVLFYPMITFWSIVERKDY